MNSPANLRKFEAFLICYSITKAKTTEQNNNFVIYGIKIHLQTLKHTNKYVLIKRKSCIVLKLLLSFNKFEPVFLQKKFLLMNRVNAVKEAETAYYGVGATKAC